MKKLLVIGALVAAFSGAGMVAITNVHAQTPPPSAPKAIVSAEPAETETKANSKPDTDNVQQQVQAGSQDVSGAPDANAR